MFQPWLAVSILRVFHGHTIYQHGTACTLWVDWGLSRRAVGLIGMKGYVIAFPLLFSRRKFLTEIFFWDILLAVPFAV